MIHPVCRQTATPPVRLMRSLPGMNFVLAAVVALIMGLLAPLVVSAAPDQVIHAFRAGKQDGHAPVGRLVFAGDGSLLYGVTQSGGQYGRGTLFSITPQGVETVLHSFGGPSDGFGSPFAGVTLFGGVLYGTTEQGGKYGDGSIWSWSPTGGYKRLHTFRGRPEGYEPSSALTAVGPYLYGTTFYGGNGACLNNGCGTVFRFNPATDNVRTVYSFKGGQDGAVPNGLVEVGGHLYGVTIIGGAMGLGTVFGMTPAGPESVLYSFKGGGDGRNPVDGLVTINNVLFGVTTGGGGNGVDCGGSGCGTVFKINRGGVETVLHVFSGPDGEAPQTGLTNIGSLLFGVADGGADGDGVAFSMTLSGDEKLLHTFKGNRDGKLPNGGLVADAAGATLYGVTLEGGFPAGCSSGCGTIYSVTPAP